MRTVEASNRITRTSSLVEMWLSGLKHLAANEASFGSARSNRAISEISNITRTSSSAERRIWDADVQGSIPWSWINDDVTQQAECRTENPKIVVRLHSSSRFFGRAVAALCSCLGFQKLESWHGNSDRAREDYLARY